MSDGERMVHPENEEVARVMGMFIDRIRTTEKDMLFKISDSGLGIERIDADMAGASRADHPDTSRFAGESIRKVSGKERKKVYAALAAAADGLTDEELSWAIGKEGKVPCPRRRELVLMGWVRDSGRRRKTGSRRDAIVWEAVPEAEYAGPIAVVTLWGMKAALRKIEEMAKRDFRRRDFLSSKIELLDEIGRTAEAALRGGKA